jgi:Holliday junction DNA helicase RuvA
VIAQLKGTLSEKTLDAVVLDVGGVGFAVAISLNTLSVMPQVGQPARLYTYLAVREDALQLYGFATPEERQAFELCIAVSGIGPKIALAVLSGLDPRGLARVVTEGDVGRLKRVPGIGPKTAERLVLELRDKVGRLGGGEGAASAREPGAAAASRGKPAGGGVQGDVAVALCNLGYKPADAERAAETAFNEDPSAAVEAILRRALRLLQRD